MGKFNVTLNKNLEFQKLEEVLRGNDITLRFYDEKFMPDFAIVQTEYPETLNGIEFIEEYEESGVGCLLVRPNPEQSNVIKANPIPKVNDEYLRSLGLYGLGVGVAVIDSGYDEAFCGKVEAAENFSTGPNPIAYIGHGNVVISIIKRYASRAKIYSAKVCHDKDLIDEESVHRALKWVRETEGIKVINMSIGFDRNCTGNCRLSKAVDKMSDLGYIIVAAVGNDGEEGKTTRCPACADKVISVGGLSADGNKVALFSNRGHINGPRKPDLLTSAHGVTMYEGIPSPYWGTSFAAPIISGIVGVCYHKFNEGQVKETLINSTTTLVGEEISKQGYGRIELDKLLEVLHS